jgi:uncharacterized protein (TIRG00374 family)
MIKNKMLFLRIAVAALLIGILLSNLNLEELKTVFLSVEFTWVLAAFLVIILIRVLSAVRWRYILSAYSLSLPFGELITAIFISGALGNFLPAGLGVDIIRGHQIASKHGEVAKVSATIIIDRAIGLFSMIITATVAILLPISWKIEKSVVYIIIILNIGFFFSLGLLFILRNKVIVWEKPEQRYLFNLYFAITKLVEAISYFYKIKRIIIPTFALSIVVQLLRCAIFYFLFIAVGQLLSIFYFLIFVPLILIVILIPISIGGLGIREGALILFFGYAGISPEYCVTVGVVFHALQIATLAPGFFFYITQKSQGKVTARGDAGL